VTMCVRHLHNARAHAPSQTHRAVRSHMADGGDSWQGTIRAVAWWLLISEPPSRTARAIAARRTRPALAPRRPARCGAVNGAPIPQAPVELTAGPAPAIRTRLPEVTRGRERIC
jgi:hypothetical protein